MRLSYSRKAGSDDSSCLRETKLCENIKEVRDDLYDKGYYILVYSIYTIESSTIPPYYSPNFLSSKDDFHFFGLVLVSLLSVYLEKFIYVGFFGSLYNVV